MKTNASESAYPVKYNDETGSGRIIERVETGLTKREYFAAIAMQALVSNQELARLSNGNAHICQAACSLADNLIEQLNKTENK